MSASVFMVDIGKGLERWQQSRMLIHLVINKYLLLIGIMAEMALLYQN
jgi:hypothetical protein